MVDGSLRKGVGPCLPSLEAADLLADLLTSILRLKVGQDVLPAELNSLVSRCITGH